MASPEAAAWLARLVRLGKISETQALFLARRPPDPKNVPLPYDAGQVSRELNSKYVSAYQGRWAGEGAIRLSRSKAVRAQYRDRLQADYEKQVAALAHSVATRRISVTQWQQRMSDAISNHTIRQAALGAGRTMSKAEVLRVLEPKIRQDLLYLQRMSDELGLRIEAKAPWSPAYIAQRSSLYAGTGRAEWFLQSEQADAKPDWIVRYIARDDGGTCFPCHAASREYYLPGQGIMPGKACKGRSRCRCKRELIHNPAIYKRLINEQGGPFSQAETALRTA